MLRAVLISFAMLAASAGLGAAQQAAEAIDSQSDAHKIISNGISNEQPTPKSNSAAGRSSVGQVSDEDTAAENELLEAANRSRGQAGVARLRIDESLREAARAHARLMIANERFEHQLPGEAALLQRIAAASGELKIDRAGENLAYSNCAPGANDALMRSAPHRANLLDGGFNIAGVAAFWSGGKLYVVQDFAHEVPTYSAEQSRKLIAHSVDDVRQQAGLPELAQLSPPNLDEAACKLANENRPNAHLLATAYSNRKIIAYTESHPETLPTGALRLLRDPGVRQFAVGSCYARNVAYPTGVYWVAILLY